MDDRVVLPPLPPVEPGESAHLTLVRELYSELHGRVLRSTLDMAARYYLSPDDERTKHGRARERRMAARAKRTERDAPLRSMYVDALLATALHDDEETTVRRIHAHGLTPLLAGRPPGLLLRPMPPVPETAQLITALERRSLSVVVADQRTQMAHGQARCLEVGGHSVTYVEYDDVVGAERGAAGFLAQRATLPQPLPERFRIYRGGRLVVLYQGAAAPVLAALNEVLTQLRP
jgi:hypothetical protein